VGLSLQPWEALRRLAAEWWVTMHRVRDATVDPLTGVWNRRGFLEAWQRAAGGWQAGTVAFVDVDHFADVNNRWGHLTGDRILRALAQLFQQVAQEGKGWVARWGGDEFLLAWPRALDTREWQATEQTIRARLAHVQAEEDWPCRVTVSGGAVNWQGTPPPLETLLERADQLLYQAKRAGRHRFVGALAEESSFSPEGPHPSGRAPELTQ
jgi:diguanylate cyclase (GGDEF)-like protein